MSKQQQELENKWFPREKLIKAFVHYYGEEHRKHIEETINSQKFVMVATDLAKYEIMQMFKEKYKNNEKINYEERAETFIINLESLNDHSNLFSPLILGKDMDILAKMGFDVKKIIKRDKETGLPVLNEGKETEQLRTYMETSKKWGKIIDRQLDIDQVAEYYNKCIDDGCLRKMRIGIDCVMDKYKVENCFGYSPKAYDTSNFPKIKQPLTKEDKNLLNDILSAKGPMVFWNDGFSKYVLDGVNKIFGKEYKTIKEFSEDKSLMIFFEIRKLYILERDKRLKMDNINHEEYKSKEDKEAIYEEAQTHLYNGAAAYHKGVIVAAQMNQNTNMRTIIHEVNHAVAGDAGKFDNVGLNEIVNEFLTGRLCDSLLEEQKAELGVKTDSKSLYFVALNCMKRFLLKFENVFKQGQLGNACKNLKNFIGEKNYVFVEAIGTSFQNMNYGIFNVPIIKDGHNNVSRADEWLELYEKDPIKASQINDDIKSTQKESELGLIISMVDYLDRLVENYQEFEQGNKVEMVPEHKSLTEWIKEKINTKDMQDHEMN